ncbi:MAG TPA: hypothetical protein QF461_05945, partial [Candidatus Thalassarchaeum sp.]|nr:hypothetical protein [Candidatus Thalassarchaeum sp.]
MRVGVQLLVLLLLGSSLSGCFFWKDDGSMEEEEVGPFSFNEPIPETTWYHYPGTVSEPWAVDATDPVVVASAN